jgi:hypothetical protein
MTAGIAQKWRRLCLWLCLGLFIARVLGQFEALLLEPSWLPPFEAWSSGLIPYSTLLPIQVLIIAWMAAIASDHSRGQGPFWLCDGRKRTALRVFAAIYAASMLLRFLILLAYPPHTLLNRGLIPIVAHWDLAIFIYLVTANLMPARAEPQSTLANAVAGLCGESRSHACEACAAPHASEPRQARSELPTVSRKHTAR